MTTFDKIIKQNDVHMTFYISHVASNSLYRDIEVRFFDEDTQSFINIADDLANELQMQVKNGGVRIHGVGMNMAFALSQRIIKHVQEKYGKEIQIDNHIFTRSEMDLYVDFIQRFAKENQKAWILESYDQWFSYSSRIPFGVFTSREKAIEAMYKNYSKEALGKDAELYENGTNQWKSDVLSGGIIIREFELNKYEEI